MSDKKPSNFRAAAEALLQIDPKLAATRAKLAAKLLQPRWVDRREATVDPKSKR